MRGSARRDYLVVESDESDGSFLKLAPIIAIVTNIDREHLDHYSDIDEIRRAFAEFVGKVPFYGAAILCLDDENVQQILPSVNRRIITYGWSAQADLRITSSSTGHMASEFHLDFRDRDLGCFRLHVPGAHNVRTRRRRSRSGWNWTFRSKRFAKRWRAFSGVDRRFQVRGTERGVTVIDDYGHHPTEIRATLAAARACRFNRVHVLFQPHRYTRTAALMDDFARAFHQADSVHVMDIYAASEAPDRRRDRGGAGGANPRVRASRRAVCGIDGARDRIGPGGGGSRRRDRDARRRQRFASGRKNSGAFEMRLTIQRIG